LTSQLINVLTLMWLVTMTIQKSNGPNVVKERSEVIIYFVISE